MGNFALDQVLDRFRRGLLWFIVNILFTTKELKNEAMNHYHFGVIRIPGVCYGCNLARAFSAIGELFPQRRWVVRLDFLLGYLKLLLMMACTFIAFYVLTLFLG